MMRMLKVVTLSVLIVPAGAVQPVSASEAIPFVGAARPHIVWQYTFHQNGDPHNPRVARDYITCTYVGPYGEFTVHAEAGDCPWMKMFTPDDSAGALRHRPWAN